MVAHVVFVQELVLTTLDLHFYDLVTRRESVFEDASGSTAFKLRANESSSFSRFYVLKFNDSVDVIVELHTESILNVGRTCHNFYVVGSAKVNTSRNDKAP